ncbi:transporter substrate-binding domain-containing protein, partial [Pseudomonas sp.]|uniref:transporter substrate-binding domain-containing protein n=1 Tax=Pseudomonas sp. TaxID=306 RepID=UPI003BAE1BBC
MYLRPIWLSICLIAFSASLHAAPLPLPLQVLSSQLHIDRHDIAISTDDWHWLRHKGEIRLGISPSESAPFAVNAEDNQYEGISADATALVSQLLGVQVKIVPFASDAQALQALQAGSIDMINSHGSHQPRENLILSTPYARDRLALFKRSAEPRHSPIDLAGLRVATTAAHSEDLRKRFPRADFRVYADHDKAIAAASFGQADVYLDDLYSAYYRINRSFYGFVRFERFTDLSVGGYSYALRADSTRLQHLL